MGATFASTVYNSGIVQVQRRFDVNSEVALAGMSLYLFGCGSYTDDSDARQC